MDIEEHVDELARELDVERDELRTGLENLIEYDVPIAEAKQSLRRRYGEGTGGDGGPSTVDIAAIDTTTGNVTVTARVLRIGKRPIQYEGEERVILEGELADESGTISFTAWEDFEIEIGDTLRIGNATVREWEGRPELNFGENSTVERLDTTLEVPAAVGASATLRDLKAGDRGVEISVSCVEVESRTIDGRQGRTSIKSGVLADETARLPFTDWADHDLIVPDADLTIENAYVREYRGVPSVNLSRFSVVREAEEPIESAGPTRVTIGEAVDRGGVYDLALRGNVLEVRENSGLIQRCPECNRIVQGGECRTHGEVDPVDDLRTKAILDDGSGTVTIVLDADQTATIYGGDVAAARSAARDAMDQAVVAEAIADGIVGREYLVRGHLSVDEYGATLEVTEFSQPTDAVADRAKSVLDLVATDGGTTQ